MNEHLELAIIEIYELTLFKFKLDLSLFFGAEESLNLLPGQFRNGLEVKGFD